MLHLTTPLNAEVSFQTPVSGVLVPANMRMVVVDDNTILGGTGSATEIQRITVVNGRAATVTAESVPFPAIVPCDRLWAPESGEAPLTLSCHGIIDGVNVLTDEDGRSFLSASHTAERRLIATVESANDEFPDARQQIRVFPVQLLGESFAFPLPAIAGAVTATHVAFSPDGERLMVLAERDGGYLYGLFPTDQL